MFFIRQGATHKVVIGPVVAVGDGFTPVTTLSVGTADEAEAILHDNGTVVDISGYTFAAITTADGYYHLTLQSGISGTVGHVTIVINDDSLCLPVKAEFTVVEEAVYDAYYAASATGVPAAAATAAAQTTAQDDLDILTGTDGVILNTTQANYAPAKAGDSMALVNDAITASKYDETTAFPLASVDSGSTQVARTGADGDTLETLSDEIAVVDGNVDSILADTNELQTDWANNGRLDVILDARASQTSVDTVDGNVDLILADTGTDGVVVAAASKTGYRLSSTGVDDILDEAVEGTRTLRQILRGYSSALLAKLSGGGTATEVFRDIDDSKDRITATVDEDGNRTAITLDLT